jgi:PAS domain S-box-containing protein
MRAITDSAHDAIVMMDPKGRITFWNPAAERILGYTSAEALGQDLHDLIAPVRFLPEYNAAFPAFQQTGQGAAVGKALDFEARRKDGLEIPVQLSLSAVQMDDGWHGVGIIRDATESKQAELEIQHQATFARFNPNPVLELSASGDINYFNHAAAIVRECLAAGTPKLRLEIQIGPRVISWSFFPVKFNNTVHCYAGDVTARKQAEEALRLSETKFRTLFDSTGDAVMLLGEKAFLDCNPATLAMFGCAIREEFCSKHPADVSPPMQPDGTDSPTLANQQIATAVEKGSHRFEWMHKRADTGEAFPADVLLSVMNLGGKQVLQATVRDITERKQSEERLQLQSAALEAAANAIVITDQSGNIQSVNPAFTALTGYSAQEVVGKNPRLLKSGQQDEAFYRNLWQTISSGQVWSGEVTNRRKDGSLYAEEMTITPLRNAAGVIARYIAIKQDVSGRKRAEEALRQSEEQLRAMFELASVGIAQADPRTGQWLRVNQKMCEITGYSAGELLQMRVPDITHPEDRQSDQEAFQRVVRGETPDYRMEKRYLRKDGALAWVNVNMTVIRDSAGQPTRTMATIEDITERKRSEESLRLFRYAAEQAEEAFVITDAQFDQSGPRILFVNPAFTKMTGYTAEEALGKPPPILLGAHTDEAMLARLRQTLARGEAFHSEVINSRKDGSGFYSDMHIAPIRGPNGLITHFVAGIRDITERKRLEAQLFQSQKMETVGRLAGGIAHEFNSLLTTILGYSDLLLGGLPAGSPLAEHATEISQAAGRAATLTRQLLAYGRKQFLQPEILNLNQVLAGMEVMFHHLMGGDVETQIVPAPDLHAVKADAGQIEQVIMNLAMNARDAMPKGGKLTLATANVSFDQESVGRDSELKPGDYVMLAVTDTGAGMSEDVKARLFEPFFTTKGVGQGTGLGLSTCYGIIKQSGGHTSVQSEPERGSTFKIYLPRAEAQTRIPIQRPDSPALPRGTQTILPVEDDPALREVAGGAGNRSAIDASLIADK